MLTAVRQSAVRQSAVRPRSAHGRSVEQDRRDRHLVEAAQASGDPGARTRAVTELLPLARRLARRYHRGGEPLEDLEQVACVGLLKAVDGFDLERDTPFSAYAIPTITSASRRCTSPVCFARSWLRSATPHLPATNLTSGPRGPHEHHP